MRASLTFSSLVALLALAACESPPGDPAPAGALARSHRPELVTGPAPGTALAPWLAAERKIADGRGQQLVVYVGATWCEPCQHFHRALLAGELDRELPDVRFVEFDLDRSRDDLAGAGYASPMIPLFALPSDDGRGGAARIYGSVKGPAAAREIAPRLVALLGRPGS